MPTLVIDIGNSFVKSALYADGTVSYNQPVNFIDNDYLLELIGTGKVDHLIVSSVRADFGFSEHAIPNDVKYVKFDGQTKIPIHNKYQTPLSLGLDRLAGIIAATELYPKQAVLVIDAGTCITYDSINPEAVYFGGSISPGIKMRFDAMHHFTAKLPQLDFNANFDATFGRNSDDAMSSGVINGCIYEVEGFIKAFLNANESGKIILTGGDSSFFDSKFKNSIFANLILHEPNLVLIGLNTVVNYQHDLK